MVKGKNNTDKEKEHDKFNEIYHIHGEYLFRIGMSILKNESDSEEALQLCLIKTYKNIDKIGAVDAKETKSYICIIMEHACIGVQRKIKIESNKLVTEPMDEALYIIDERADVEETFAKAELERDVQKYLGELKEDAKQR